MKKSMIALAAGVLVVPTLWSASADAGRIRRPVGTGSVLGFDLFQAQPGATQKSASGSTAYYERLRRQRAAKAAQAARETQAVKAPASSQVAASAQVVKTPPVLATTSVASRGVSGQAPPSLDCRQFIPSAAMTISVACSD